MDRAATFITDCDSGINHWVIGEYIASAHTNPRPDIAISN